MIRFKIRFQPWIEAVGKRWTSEGWTEEGWTSELKWMKGDALTYDKLLSNWCRLNDYGEQFRWRDFNWKRLQKKWKANQLNKSWIRLQIGMINASALSVKESKQSKEVFLDNLAESWAHQGNSLIEMCRCSNWKQKRGTPRCQTWKVLFTCKAVNRCCEQIATTCEGPKVQNRNFMWQTIEEVRLELPKSFFRRILSRESFEETLSMKRNEPRPYEVRMWHEDGPRGCEWPIGEETSLKNRKTILSTPTCFWMPKGLQK